MEALCIQPWEEEEEVTMKEQELEKRGEQEEGGMEASSPACSTTDEDTDEDSEPEPSPVIRRRVSFADAFGLDLVSVKEFDNVEVKDPEEREATRPLEDFYMTCLFTVPSTPEELDQRLQAQMVELESIELLRGTTSIRGIIRVVNLCYCKTVHARVSLDRWQSYFDLLAEYVPGSSDRKTDRFTFQCALVPPFQKGGTRVEICLRYHTSVGTFWANYKGMNYVLFCHQKGHANEHEPQTQEESGGYRSRRSNRSCLKASRRGGAEEKTRETSYTSPVVAHAEASDKAEGANRGMTDGAQIQSLLRCKERKPLVDSIKSRRRATRLARVQDYLTHRSQRVPKAYSHDSVSSHDVCQPLPAPRGDSAGVLHKRQKNLSNGSPRVLTYHEIPLLTLDWNANRSHQSSTAEMDDVWPGRTEMTLTKASAGNIDDTPSVSDMWEMFCNGTDDTTDKEISVCDEWQQFLNGSSGAGHCGVPESEWLQTAASVSPSNDKESKTQHAGKSQEHDSQVGSDTPTTSRAHVSVSCQLLSDICRTSLDNVASNTADRKPAQPCVSSPTDDNASTRDASGRSETHLVTDTLREFSPGGEKPVSEDNVENSTECHKHAVWERVRERIREGAEGIGGDDLVTSSGELETADMAAKEEGLNASGVDRISDGARLDEGLSSSREGQETGAKHNMMDDRLAFRETIRQGTKNRERFVFSISKHGVEEAILNTCMENKASAGEEIFRPQKTEECEISQRYANEEQREEFRLNGSSERPSRQNESGENETRPARSRVDEFSANQSGDDDFKLNQIMPIKLKHEESESKDVASNKEKKTAVEHSDSTAGKETRRVNDAEAGMKLVLNEKAWQHNGKDLQLNSSWQTGNMKAISDAHDEQSRPIQSSQNEEEDSKATHIQDNVELKGKRFRCDGIIEKQQDINPSAETRPTVDSGEMIKVLFSEHDTSRPLPSDKCNPTALEETKMRWSPSHDDTQGQREDGGPDEVIAKEDIAKKDTSTELQRQPETLERTEEDRSYRDEDERVKIEALGELMGNGGKNAPAQLKEQELSAEVEGSPRVECKRLSEGTRDPNAAENTAPLDMMESGLEKMFIEGFGDGLVKRIWEEVFNLKAQVSNRDLKTVGGGADKLADVPDDTQDCPSSEKDLDDAFESGVFALTENSSLCQGLEQTLAAKGSEFSPKERSQPVIPSEQTHFTFLFQDPASTSAAQRDQSNHRQIKERSVARQEAARQTEERAVAHKESLDPSDRQCHKPPRSSSEKLKDSVWWSMLYILIHVTRLLVCTLFVAGFFYLVFLCDFPAFFALYVFSLGWWFYKWRRHRATTNKAMVE